METSSSLKILGDIILIAGCVYAVIKSITELQKFGGIKRVGNFTQAEIINYTEDNSGDTKTYPAIVSYEAGGQKITATAQTSSGIKPSIGEKVWVVYDPADPSTFYFKESSVPVFAVIAIIAFGTAAIIGVLHLFGRI